MSNKNFRREAINTNLSFSFQNEMKEQWADELIIAYRELAFRNENEEKLVADFMIPIMELAFQNEERMS